MLNALLSMMVATVVPAGKPKDAPPPIACRANALDKRERKRQQELLNAVRSASKEIQELPQGFALRFPADPALFLQLAEWVSLERRCCPFLEFSLEWKQDDSVWVRLTGQPEAKEVVAAEMGLRR